MADQRDLMHAESQTNEFSNRAQSDITSYDTLALVNSNLAIASAIRELGMRIEIALREAAGRG